MLKGLTISPVPVRKVDVLYDHFGGYFGGARYQHQKISCDCVTSTAVSGLYNFIMIYLGRKDWKTIKTSIVSFFSPGVLWKNLAVIKTKTFWGTRENESAPFLKLLT